MPKKNIKLGMGMKESMLHSMPEMDEDEKHYPMLHIDTDEPLDLPHEGTMTIRFKKVSSVKREDAEGDAKYSCDIQVHEIIDAYPDEDVTPPARNRSKETGEALDALKASRSKKY